MQMQEVIEKLKDILASEGKRDLKTKDIAKELGINPDTFNSMKFRNSIPYPQILNFLNRRNISINYFFYGSSPKDQLECENKYKILKLYKTNASLGGGGINDLIDSSELIIDEKLLSFFGSKNCEFITCYGESMEPLIKDGSICVVDRNKTFKDKSLCVINTRDGLFIKQVLKQDDGVILHSLNPLYEDVFYKNGVFANWCGNWRTFKTMTAHNKLSQANLTESVKHKVVLSKKEINMKDIKNYTDKELKEKIIQDLESEFRVLYKKLLKEKDYLARDNILKLMTIYNMGINSYLIAKRFEMNEDKSLIQVPLFERYIIGRKFVVKYNNEKQRYELKSTFCEF